VIVATSLPLGTLLSQRSQLTDTAAQLSRLEAANRTLSEQAKRLQETSTVNSLARRDYGLVPAGQQAYAVLPPSGTVSASDPGTGQEPLDSPPVLPGSASSVNRLGAGNSLSVTGAGAEATQGNPGSGSAHATNRTTKPSGQGSASLLSRVLHSLEFWH
jgi:hypothetical protein